MKIAVIGAGISGMLTAYLLCEQHDVTLFEANTTLGGHTNTIQVPLGGRTYEVDTGFIVFNDWTYPNFIKLMDRLGVASQPSSMSFSVTCERTGLEYNGATLNTLFAQRWNLFRPSFYRMIRDILRFNREGLAFATVGDDRTTLGQFLHEGRYSALFIDQYVIPMGAAIWSADPRRMSDFPARYFLQFFKNHGMLSVDRRPQWRVITGGSHRYIEPLTRPYRDKVRVACPIRSVTRHPDHVAVQPQQGPPERFDHVVLASHSDQSLALLADPSPPEREILGALPYQENEAVLHTDESILPKRRLAWAAWNYHILQRNTCQSTLTYNMNILQSLDAPKQLCVTLNRADAINPASVIRRIIYHHPVYTRDGVAAQRRHGEISGVNRTSYCGAYWGFGFHEDGVKSALAVCREFGIAL